LKEEGPPQKITKEIKDMRRRKEKERAERQRRKDEEPPLKDIKLW
jgi:hypothetical protein